MELRSRTDCRPRGTSAAFLKAKINRTVLKFAVVGLAISIAAPVLAQGSEVDATTFTCAEFSGLDADAQASAVTALHAAAMAEEEASSNTEATTEESSDAGEATEESGDSAEATEESTDTEATSSGDAAESDPEVAALSAACARNDDMLTVDLSMHWVRCNKFEPPF